MLGAATQARHEMDEAMGESREFASMVVNEVNEHVFKQDALTI